MNRERIGLNWYLVKRDASGKIVSQVADDPAPNPPAEQEDFAAARAVLAKRNLTQEDRDVLLKILARVTIERWR